MQEPPDVRLELVNRPESVGAVAGALDGLVEVLGLDALEADGIQTAVVEACKNVVLHAYEGVEGPLEVELRAHATAVEVTVVDYGIGIRPHLGERRYPHNGLGMPMIHQHAWRVTYTNVPGGGTELRMEFPVDGTPAPPIDLAEAVLGRLARPLEAAAPARAEVLARSDGDAGEKLVEQLRERLGAESAARVDAQRRTPESGGPAMLVLSLSV